MFKHSISWETIGATVKNADRSIFQLNGCANAIWLIAYAIRFLYCQFSMVNKFDESSCL